MSVSKYLSYSLSPLTTISLLLLLHGAILYTIAIQPTYAQENITPGQLADTPADNVPQSTPVMTTTLGPYSDDFNRCDYADTSILWQWIHPTDTSTLSLNGTHATMRMSTKKTNKDGNHQASVQRLMQPSADIDMDLVVKFDAVAIAQGQEQGIFVEQDANNYLRFAFYVTHSNMRISATANAGKAVYLLYDEAVDVSPAAVSLLPEFYLRLIRKGEQWRPAYTEDGVNWQYGLPFTHHLTVTAVGPFVGMGADVSSNPIDVQSDTDPIDSELEISAMIDYFFNSTFPIVPEDGKRIGPTATAIGEGTVTYSPTKALYPCGARVRLDAQPPHGWRFAGWQGAFMGMTNPVEITATVDQAITATFAKESYRVNMVSVGHGQLIREPLMVAYPYSSVVSLQAIPEKDWRFVGWTGDITDVGNPIRVTVDRAKTIRALFVSEHPTETHTLTTPVVGQGQVRRTPDATQYLTGTIVTLTAKAATGWAFSHWMRYPPAGSDLLDNPLSVIMDNHQVFTATFAPITVPFSVTTYGGGFVDGTVPPGRYPYGTIITLTANPAPDSQFLYWSGDLQGSRPQETFALDGPKQIVAYFGPITHTLDVQISGMGDVIADRGKPYQHNQRVQLTAYPRMGWSFIGWEGELIGTQNPIEVTMNSDKIVIALFSLNISGTKSYSYFLPIVNH